MACQPKLRDPAPVLLPPDLIRRTEDNLRCCAAQVGGARRDRTDDLKLAKLALSQLSYGPDRERNNKRCLRGVGWWARDELNVRPHAYQACALTT